MNFKDKKWGIYKKWTNHSYLYFHKVEHSLFITRPNEHKHQILDTRRPKVQIYEFCNL